MFGSWTTNTSEKDGSLSAQGMVAVWRNPIWGGPWGIGEQKLARQKMGILRKGNYMYQGVLIMWLSKLIVFGRKQFGEETFPMIFMLFSASVETWETYKKKEKGWKEYA